MVARVAPVLDQVSVTVSPGSAQATSAEKSTIVGSPGVVVSVGSCAVVGWAVGGIGVGDDVGAANGVDVGGSGAAVAVAASVGLGVRVGGVVTVEDGAGVAVLVTSSCGLGVRARQPTEQLAIRIARQVRVRRSSRRSVVRVSIASLYHVPGGLAPMVLQSGHRGDWGVNPAGVSCVVPRVGRGAAAPGAPLDWRRLVTMRRSKHYSPTRWQAGEWVQAAAARY